MTGNQDNRRVAFKVVVYSVTSCTHTAGLKTSFAALWRKGGELRDLDVVDLGDWRRKINSYVVRVGNAQMVSRASTKVRISIKGLLMATLLVGTTIWGWQRLVAPSQMLSEILRGGFEGRIVRFSIEGRSHYVNCEDVRTCTELQSVLGTMSSHWVEWPLSECCRLHCYSDSGVHCAAFVHFSEGAIWVSDPSAGCFDACHPTHHATFPTLKSPGFQSVIKYLSTDVNEVTDDLLIDRNGALVRRKSDSRSTASRDHLRPAS